MLRLHIGNLNITLVGIKQEHIPLNTLLFQSDKQESDLTYTFHFENKTVFPILYPIIYQTPDITIFRKANNCEARLLYLPKTHDCYAYYEELNEQEINIYVNRNYEKQLHIDTIFISLLALERHLARKNAFILHCAYMEFNDKAILFSGPSGIGKSTHSNLWCKYFPQKATMINGDKCLLTQENNKLFANGWPICGSSEICKNEKKEVAAIILLKQAPINQLITEKPISYFKKLLAQTTINYWNHTYLNYAMSFLGTILQQTGCITYACNISEEAVLKLYNEIKKEKWIY